MIIRYLGSVRAVTGERKLHWERRAAMLRELLRDLALYYGPRFKYWILAQGNVPDQHTTNLRSRRENKECLIDYFPHYCLCGSRVRA
jgi:molybdopterin converting factor small subunit